MMASLFLVVAVALLLSALRVGYGGGVMGRNADGGRSASWTGSSAYPHIESRPQRESRNGLRATSPMPSCLAPITKANNGCPRLRVSRVVPEKNSARYEMAIGTWTLAFQRASLFTTARPSSLTTSRHRAVLSSRRLNACGRSEPGHSFASSFMPYSRAMRSTTNGKPERRGS